MSHRWLDAHAVRACSGNSARFDELQQEVRLLFHRRNRGRKQPPNLERLVLAETAQLMLRFKSSLVVRLVMQ